MEIIKQNRNKIKCKFLLTLKLQSLSSDVTI